MASTPRALIGRRPCTPTPSSMAVQRQMKLGCPVTWPRNRIARGLYPTQISSSVAARRPHLLQAANVGDVAQDNISGVLDEPNQFGFDAENYYADHAGAPPQSDVTYHRGECTVSLRYHQMF
uniref:Uncharacterized protein n=1 Tax=Oryza punctata TaxID=4537 RepID=A0A0E0LCW6_ORYPU